MQLSFVKRTGKNDELTIVRNTGVVETIACPKQRIIPHDMGHYAVESILGHQGFLSLVEDGAAANFAAIGGDSAEAIERLVETFQAEMWGGRVSAIDLLATYEHACAARCHPVVAVSVADVTAIRERLDELTELWTSLPVNEALTFEF